MAQEWEATFKNYEITDERGVPNVALPPEDFNKLSAEIADKFSDLAAAGTSAALVTSSLRRRFLKTVLRAKGLSSPVYSFEEIGMEARPAIVGMIAH